MDDATPDGLLLGPTSFRREHETVDAEAELASLVWVLDLQEALPSVQRLRDWVVHQVAPRPGETAVDVGSGTGTTVSRLAELVGPGGRAVGVEPHPGLRAEADRRAVGTEQYVDGDALRLPFADGSVDVLVCERVWQHLSEPGRAAAEVARVLAPGGRAAVTDTDWGTSIGRAGDPEVRRRHDEAMWARMANPFSGRDLRAHLQAAGLRVRPDIGSTALVLPDAQMRSAAMLDVQSRLAVAEGVVTQQEADRLRADVVLAAERGEGFMSVTMFTAVAEHPVV